MLSPDLWNRNRHRYSTRKCCPIKCLELQVPVPNHYPSCRALVPPPPPPPPPLPPSFKKHYQSPIITFNSNSKKQREDSKYNDSNDRLVNQQSSKAASSFSKIVSPVPFHTTSPVLYSNKNSLHSSDLDTNVIASPGNNINSVESIDLSELVFRPGNTSTPQGSASELENYDVVTKNSPLGVKSNRSIVSFALNQRRLQIATNSDTILMSKLDENNTIWDESISPNKQSSSSNKTLIYGADVKSTPNTSVSNIEQRSKEPMDYLQQKLENAKNLRLDPAIDALLADIRARRKSSSSFQN
ncbi:hypothetical protein DPMN_080273 [Dreissena polymorpha]|uniref:Uncharacterized protein n=1 Tax=Dreissena polymorpha TaxID=45954 RepID=A0A9D3YR34_DREPO|nr:hypothetical protein DPMN_080273 [Dreissena polymorpha]